MVGSDVPHLGVQAFLLLYCSEPKSEARPCNPSGRTLLDRSCHLVKNRRGACLRGHLIAGKSYFQLLRTWRRWGFCLSMSTQFSVRQAFSHKPSLRLPTLANTARCILFTQVNQWFIPSAGLAWRHFEFKPSDSPQDSGLESTCLSLRVMRAPSVVRGARRTTECPFWL